MGWAGPGESTAGDQEPVLGPPAAAHHQPLQAQGPASQNIIIPGGVVTCRLYRADKNIYKKYVGHRGRLSASDNW